MDFESVAPLRHYAFNGVEKGMMYRTLTDGDAAVLPTELRTNTSLSPGKQVRHSFNLESDHDNSHWVTPLLQYAFSSFGKKVLCHAMKL